MQDRYNKHATESIWITRALTILMGFTIYTLKDIHEDFKSMRDEVIEHRYQIKNINEEVERLKSHAIAYEASARESTEIKQAETWK